MSNILGNEASQFNKGEGFKSLLPFIEAQIPYYKKADATSNFLPFLQSYYEWLEQPGNVLDILHSLPKIADTQFGGASDDFFESYRKETLSLIPNSLIQESTRKLILNIIVQVYLAKGVAAALEFGLRTFYGANVSISYDRYRKYLTPPATTKIVDEIIFSIPVGVDPESLNGATIVGQLTGVTRKIDTVTLLSHDYVYSLLGNVTFYPQTFQPSNALLENNTDNIELENTTGDMLLESDFEPHPSTVVVKATLQTFGPEFASNEACIVTLNGNTTPSYSVSVLIVAGRYIINNPGTGYAAGDAIPILTPGSGAGFDAVIGSVTGSISEINIIENGIGYNSGTYPVSIIGDGTGATAQLVVQNGVLQPVQMLTAGSGYTKAQAYIVVPANQTQPTQYATFDVVIRGGIRTLAIRNQGLGYEGSAPTLKLTPIGQGTGADITVLSSTVAGITINDAFDGNFTKVQSQIFNTLMVLKDGSSNFIARVGQTPGETVTQSDSNGNILWSAEVIGWNAATRELITTQFDLNKFSHLVQLVGGTSGASWSFGGKYSRPVIVDAGNGDVAREYTYFINLPAGSSLTTYSTFINKNFHPAGLRYFGITNQTAIDVDGNNALQMYFGDDFNSVEPGTQRTQYRRYITSTQDVLTDFGTVKSISSLGTNSYEGYLIYENDDYVLLEDGIDNVVV